MHRPVQILVVAALVSLTAACSSGPQHVDGAAAPAGLASPAASLTSEPAAVPSAVSKSPTPSSPPPSRTTSTALTDLTIDPDRIGRLRIGMSLTAAKATGLIVVIPGQEDRGPEGCVAAYWKGRSEDDGMIFNGKYGLRALGSFGNQRTPEGIRPGSTLAAVREAYPRLTWRVDGDETTDAERTSGDVLVDVVKGDGAHYRINIQDSKVTSVGLESDRAGCYE
ncbi:hypothetical protein Ait01nite_079870 [Actinoplanes italicus]|uniref:Uncharacterized protein n=1 Tax=Actinoplanes italicus TaxID=113567 RepID=A0A2T0JR67_9ACTN|nr:hypothetical protein [Actinoplanes italicus]PRX10137.1 hypothetical protein CLV67_13421 [Actinoplanes italicus]GIE34942.1 hypothetical protein Ait01nite_079870 [Actinoplanes italicus]